MARTVCLLGCLLVLAAAAGRDEPPISLRLSKGHELSYLGVVQEEEPGRTGVYRRNWKLDLRALVLDAGEHTTLATLTVLRSAHSAETRADPPPASVRLELCEIDSLGRLHNEEKQLAWRALDGPSTWELGFFVETPDAPTANRPWLVSEAGRPPRRYRVAGEDPVNGVMCLKVEGEQQSADWDRPRADSTAWHIRETLWLTPRTGHAQQVERLLERRDPAHREAGYRLLTRYKLDNAVPYQGQFFEDRRREIQQAQRSLREVMELLPDAGYHGPRPFETRLARVNHFMDRYAETPYREALRHAQRLAEAGRRNEAPLQLVAARLAPTLALGKPAPDFVVADIQTGKNLTLRQWRGQVLLMAFYHPKSATAGAMLGHLQKMTQDHAKQKLAIVAFVMSDDLDAAHALAGRLSLTLPQGAGTNLRAGYEVKATPYFVLIDADGLVAARSTGWGPETPAGLEADIQGLKQRPPGDP